jgi:uncharacterized protein (TIGR02391 family)
MGRGSPVDRYIAWAWEQGKFNSLNTERNYRHSLEDLAAAINPKPIEDVSEEDLREFQFAWRQEVARTWNRKCAAIREFCRYLVLVEDRLDDPSTVLKNRPQHRRHPRDPDELELLISALEPTTRLVAQLVRETGWSLELLQQVEVRPDRIPATIRARDKQGKERVVELTPVGREVLQRLGGRLPKRKRSWQREFQEAGFRAIDVAKMGPSRSLSLEALHPRITLEVRRQILTGTPELAVFAAFKEVEIRVRELTGMPSSVVGVDLMKQAFRRGGPLANATLDPGEQEAIMALFWGGIGVFKNPSSHRQVQFKDTTLIREVILLADLLHRMLDDVEQNLETQRAPNGPVV